MTRIPRPGFDRERDKAGCRALLEYFRSLPCNLSDSECPSSFDLIVDGRFGQRPVNRINDMVLGKFDGHRYDFERITCGRGVYRWRLHEPNRPGYPKNKSQIVLPLQPERMTVPAIESDFMRRRREEEAAAWPLFGAQP